MKNNRWEIMNRVVINKELDDFEGLDKQVENLATGIEKSFDSLTDGLKNLTEWGIDLNFEEFFGSGDTKAFEISNNDFKLNGDSLMFDIPDFIDDPEEERKGSNKDLEEYQEVVNEFDKTKKGLETFYKDTENDFIQLGAMLEYSKNQGKQGFLSRFKTEGLKNDITEFLEVEYLEIKLDKEKIVKDCKQDLKDNYFELFILDNTKYKLLKKKISIARQDLKYLKQSKKYIFNEIDKIIDEVFEEQHLEHFNSKSDQKIGDFLKSNKKNMTDKAIKRFIEFMRKTLGDDEK